jgi:hypothetical protein
MHNTLRAALRGLAAAAFVLILAPRAADAAEAARAGGAGAGGRVSVLDHGARCDGSSDDTRAFAAAAVAARGKTLYVPAAAAPCVLAGPVRITGTTSYYADKGGVIRCTGDGDCLVVNEGGNFQGQRFDHVQIVAGGAAAKGRNARLLVIENSGGGAVIDDPQISGATAGTCIAFEGSVYDFLIDAGVLRNCATALGGARSLVAQLELRKTNVQNDGKAGIGNHISIDLPNVAHLKLDKVHWSDAVQLGGGVTTIVALDCGDATVTRGYGCLSVDVEDPQLEGNFTDGLRFGFGRYSGGAGAYDITVTNPEMNGNTPQANVIRMEHVRGFSIHGKTWPANLATAAGPPPTGYAYYIDDTNSGGLIFDAGDNSAHYYVASANTCRILANAGTICTGQGAFGALASGARPEGLAKGGIGLNAATGAIPAPGINGAAIYARCGTRPGTLKLVAVAGRSAAPVTILDNIGAGVSGC